MTDLISIENPKNKDTVTFLATGRQTGGERTVLEVVLAPGGRNALHYHTTFAEHFIALDQPLQLATRDGDITLAPGESFTAQPMVLHAFFNDRDHPVRFRVELRPANESFELFLQVAYGLINDTFTLPGGFPINPLYLGVLSRLGDTRYRGILGAMMPIASLMARIAKAVGTERRLVEKYGQTLMISPPESTDS